MRYTFLLALCLTVFGCGRSAEQRSEVVPVDIQVMAPDGRPLADVVCSFKPTSASLLPGDFPLNKEGKLVVAPGATASLIPGKYAVYFQMLEGGNVSRGAAQAALKRVPAKYTDINNTVLEVEIPAGGGAQTITLEQ